MNKIPTHMMEAMDRYINHGIKPGSFLSAVIRNDLCDAIGRADDINIHLIPDYVRYFYNDAPSACWGSPAKFESWLSRFERVAA
jgi:hypothetical protein